MAIEGDSIELTAPRSLRDAFGVDGEKALEVARLISASRRVEVEKEARSRL